MKETMEEERGTVIRDRIEGARVSGKTGRVIFSA
jgi:hypothetical protein